jgi:hypothetical protein
VKVEKEDPPVCGVPILMNLFMEEVEKTCKAAGRPIPIVRLVLMKQGPSSLKSVHFMSSSPGIPTRLPVSQNSTRLAHSPIGANSNGHMPTEITFVIHQQRQKLRICIGCFITFNVEELGCFVYSGKLSV